jgi:hypothetical protein
LGLAGSGGPFLSLNNLKQQNIDTGNNRETRYCQTTSGEAGVNRWNQGMCNQRSDTPLKEVEIMLSQSWTMEWFVYLNATILAWSVLAYGYREFIQKGCRGR